MIKHVSKGWQVYTTLYYSKYFTILYLNKLIILCSSVAQTKRSIWKAIPLEDHCTTRP